MLILTIPLLLPDYFDGRESLVPKYSLISESLPEDTFAVVNFQGSEGLSLCYQFELNLVSTNPHVDLKECMQHPARFIIHREDGDIPFQGILTQLEVHQAFQEYVFYKAVLAPKFWWLTLTHHNQVFLNMTLPDIITAVLNDGGLTSLDFELRLQGAYPEREYVCQYRESHYDFLCRWMEREGVYFFFEQTDTGEKLILTDTGVAHVAMPQGRTLYYSPPSGLDAEHRQEIIQTLFCRQTMTPQRVKVKDYNYRTPSLSLFGEADVSPESGRGDFYVYGDHFRTPEEGKHLAAIRAEGLLCREQLFVGGSTVPYIRSGYVFDLERHFRSEFNQKYLTIGITHQGSQVSYLTAGLKQSLSKAEQKLTYHNNFTVIPANVQFRPEHKTPESRFYGTMNARIDAAGSGQYAELDEYGRYKVILPFDLSGRENGKASAWLRMVQPYAGSNHGMHFPLHKGTEVLLTFIDGDPDRPIVAGAIPNPLTPSPVTSANHTQSRITTSGGNRIHIEDMKGGERILLKTPKADTWIRMGTPNDPDKDPDKDEKENEGEDGAKIYSTAGFAVEAAGENKMIMGEVNDITIGVKNEILLGTEVSAKVAAALEFFYGTSFGMVAGTKLERCLHGYKCISNEGEVTGTEEVVIQAGGTSPTTWPITSAIAALTVLSTAGGIAAAQLGKSETFQKHVAEINAAAAALTALLASPVFNKLNKDTEGYQSKITLERDGIVADADKFTLTNGNYEATLGSYNLTAADQADLTYQDVLNLTVSGKSTSDFQNDLEASVTGDAQISAQNTTINSGEKTSFGVAESALTLDKDKIESVSKNLVLDGDEDAEIKSSNGSLTVSSGGAMTLSGTAGVTIQSGGIIKIGAPGQEVSVADLATAQQLRLDKEAMDNRIKAETEARLQQIKLAQAKLESMRIKIKTISELVETIPWPSSDYY